MEICIDPALAKVFREIEVAGHINSVVLKQQALYFNAVNREERSVNGVALTIPGSKPPKRVGLG